MTNSQHPDIYLFRKYFLGYYVLIGNQNNNMENVLKTRDMSPLPVFKLFLGARSALERIGATKYERYKKHI